MKYPIHRPSYTILLLWYAFCLPYYSPTPFPLTFSPNLQINEPLAKHSHVILSRSYNFDVWCVTLVLFSFHNTNWLPPNEHTMSFFWGKCVYSRKWNDCSIPLNGSPYQNLTFNLIPFDLIAEKRNFNLRLSMLYCFRAKALDPGIGHCFMAMPSYCVIWTVIW